MVWRTDLQIFGQTQVLFITIGFSRVGFIGEIFMLVWRELARNSLRNLDVGLQGDVPVAHATQNYEICRLNGNLELHDAPDGA